MNDPTISLTAVLVFTTKKASIRITGSELDTGREINIADQSGLLESTFTVCGPGSEI